MNYQIVPPGPLLENYVRYFWSIELENESASEFLINGLVDDSTGIIFQSGKEDSAFKSNGIMLNKSFIYGQHTRPTLTEAISGFSAFGVLFHPWAISELFNLDAGKLVNQLVEPGQMIVDTLSEKILNERSLQVKIELVSDFLLRSIMRVKKENMLIRNCVKNIKHHNGMLTVKHLHNYYHVSSRQLERNFIHCVGVSPRHLLKVTRFNHALELIKTRQYKRLSDLAHALDYSDQAHFIRVAKELSGFSPKSLQLKLENAMLNLIM